MENKKGFTLAEVLITLSILGVVAGITIPNIISNYKKKYTELRLKQAYSILDNTIDIAKIENNIDLTTMTYNSVHNIQEMNSFAYFLENYMAKYMNISKKCYSGGGDCLGFGGYNLDGGGAPNGWIFKDLSGVIHNESTYTSISPQILLKNGMAIAIKTMRDDGLIYLAVDINGRKGPNQLCYDVFYFSFLSGTGTWGRSDKDLLIAGRFPSYTMEKTASYDNLGLSCSATIKNNGWKIPKDYPAKF